MKKLLAVLALLGLCLAPPHPAQAQDDMMCPGDMTPTIASLRQCVQHAYEMGHIDNRGIASSLLAQLDAAQAAADRVQNPRAIQILKGFIREVQAQSGAHIDPMHADHMIMHAQMVIQALGA